MAQDPPPTGAGGIRIGHRERDAVAAVLQEAAADGRLKVKVPRDPAPGKPLLVIYGSLGMGSLKVRPPNSLDQRRIAGTDHHA
jgi:hypothetical protein